MAARRASAGPAAREAAYRRQQEQLAANRADVTRRYLAAYLAEPDRDYAEVMYGDTLRARGVETATLNPLKEP